MAYLNLTTAVLASAQRQGLTPLAFLESRLAVWQYDFGTDEWPEKLNVSRRQNEEMTAYESSVLFAFDTMSKKRGPSVPLEKSNG